MDKIKVGKIVGTHGLKGELKIRGNDEVANDVLVKGNTIIINYNNEDIPFTIITKRVHKTNHLVTFDGFQDINAVEKYIGSTVFSNKDDVHLEEDEYLVSDIVGCKIYNGKEYLGDVIDVLDNGRHDILVVSVNGKKVMIPYVDAFIVEDDVDNNCITVSLIEGML